MDRSMAKGLVIGGFAMVVVAAAGVTGYKAVSAPQFAEVLAVKEAKETITTPRQECADVQVQTQAPVKDTHRAAGTVAGAVAGGLLGSAIGGGRGKTAATVVGAVAGGYTGNQVQKNIQQKDVVTTTEQRCKTVNDTSEKLLGYDVTYRLDGRDATVRMAYDPGKQIPVKDGQLVIDAPEPKK